LAVPVPGFGGVDPGWVRLLTSIVVEKRAEIGWSMDFNSSTPAAIIQRLSKINKMLKVRRAFRDMSAIATSILSFEAAEAPIKIPSVSQIRFFNTSCTFTFLPLSYRYILQCIVNG
jgi:hypothetical protein